LLKAHGLNFGRDRTGEDLGLNPQQKPVIIVRNPSRGPFKFSVRLKLVLFVYPLQSQIELYRAVGPGMHFDALMADYCYRRNVGRIGWVDG